MLVYCAEGKAERNPARHRVGETLEVVVFHDLLGEQAEMITMLKPMLSEIYAV